MLKSHIDEAIAFNYPADFLLADNIEGQYSLVRGDAFFLIELLNDALDWRMSIADTARVVKMPQHDVVRGATGIPGGKMWSEDYGRHGFSGKKKTYLQYNISNAFSGKAVTLALERGQHRIEVRASDRVDFSDDIVEHLLASIAFPGEVSYEQFAALPQADGDVKSPYAVALPAFATLGRDSPASKTQHFNVTYEGGVIQNAQTMALEDFKAAEHITLENVKDAILKYYTQKVRPMGLELFDDATASLLYPPAESSADIVPLVEFGTLVVHQPRADGRVPIGIRLRCQWDEEHGLGLRAVGTEVEAIGTYYVALDSDLVEWPDFE